ncbi:aldehyde ferredoxin oxidoreductase family protein [Maledivibacter halophilus]|uniref:Aldehyde:ferredoxin oxidoreductase n=1 Tax=Maledivibacter halophilus TaxID=36842 RepID=A0A1T5L175_9FIRM|nr:aldehyde ferredoxin oxidoreductase family protein [Maledivibacter halophilus]SKC69465.1 aldehyde:ferredoxin oxidoreductase [Maledivibacter halophilus]
MIFPDAKILDVDLTNGKIEKRTIPGEIYRMYPGGSALGLYIILNEMDPMVEPLSPENILVFSVSPLVGFPISGANRMTVTTKSPLTNTIGDSQAGGFFSAYLKGNGWDAVVFRGKAEKPIYLYIDGEDVELKDGSNAWGKVTGEAEKVIRKELREDKIDIAQIGPGGENLVKFACIINMCNRANGRNGTGAVMGSKNLKAIAVKKKTGRQPVDKEGFKALAGSIKERLAANQPLLGLGEHGTDINLEPFNEEGFLPTKNWSTGWFPEGANNISGPTMTKTILKERDTCYACTVRCKRVVEVPGKVDPLYGGPEYETCGGLGSYCGITNLETVALGNQLCNMYGLDTISTGGTIAFAMECFEKGIIDKSHTNGLELTFGNDDVMPIIIEKIAKREGVGDLLAEGSYRAAKKIGGEAYKYSISVKGQELPAHMPEMKSSVGLIYAVNPFGADHQSHEHDPVLTLPEDSKERVNLSHLGVWKGYDNMMELDDEKVRFAFNTQCFFSLMDTLCLCQFVWGPSWEAFGPKDLVEFAKVAIGWDTSIHELMLIGERRINMMRYFNSKIGFDKKDDYLPDRVFEPFEEGPSKGIAMDKEKFNEALNTYYSTAGWDLETGNPTKGSLKKLSLGWLLEI